MSQWKGRPHNNLIVLRNDYDPQVLDGLEQQTPVDGFKKSTAEILKSFNNTLWKTDQKPYIISNKGKGHCLLFAVAQALLRIDPIYYIRLQQQLNLKENHLELFTVFALRRAIQMVIDELPGFSVKFQRFVSVWIRNTKKRHRYYNEESVLSILSWILDVSFLVVYTEAQTPKKRKLHVYTPESFLTSLVEDRSTLEVRQEMERHMHNVRQRLCKRNYIRGVKGLITIEGTNLSIEALQGHYQLVAFRAAENAVYDASPETVLDPRRSLSITALGSRTFIYEANRVDGDLTPWLRFHRSGQALKLMVNGALQLPEGQMFEYHVFAPPTEENAPDKSHYGVSISHFATATPTLGEAHLRYDRESNRVVVNQNLVLTDGAELFVYWGEGVHVPGPRTFTPQFQTAWHTLGIHQYAQRVLALQNQGVAWQKPTNGIPFYRPASMTVEQLPPRNPLDWLTEEPLYGHAVAEAVNLGDVAAAVAAGLAEKGATSTANGPDHDSIFDDLEDIEPEPKPHQLGDPLLTDHDLQEPAPYTHAADNGPQTLSSNSDPVTKALANQQYGQSISEGRLDTRDMIRFVDLLEDERMQTFLFVEYAHFDTIKHTKTPTVPKFIAELRDPNESEELLPAAILVPYHLRFQQDPAKLGHWILFVLMPRAKQFCVLNSLVHNKSDYEPDRRHALKRVRELLPDWTEVVIDDTNVMRQQTGTQCGLYVLLWMLYIRNHIRSTEELTLESLATAIRPVDIDALGGEDVVKRYLIDELERLQPARASDQHPAPRPASASALPSASASPSASALALASASASPSASKSAPASPSASEVIDRPRPVIWDVEFLLESLAATSSLLDEKQLSYFVRGFWTPSETMPPPLSTQASVVKMDASRRWISAYVNRRPPSHMQIDRLSFVPQKVNLIHSNPGGWQVVDPLAMIPRVDSPKLKAQLEDLAFSNTQTPMYHEPQNITTNILANSFSVPLAFNLPRNDRDLNDSWRWGAFLLGHPNARRAVLSAISKHPQAAATKHLNAMVSSNSTRVAEFKGFHKFVNDHLFNKPPPDLQFGSGRQRAYFTILGKKQTEKGKTKSISVNDNNMHGVCVAAMYGELDNSTVTWCDDNGDWTTIVKEGDHYKRSLGGCGLPLDAATFTMWMMFPLLLPKDPPTTQLAADGFDEWERRHVNLIPSGAWTHLLKLKSRRYNVNIEASPRDIFHDNTTIHRNVLSQLAGNARLKVLSAITPWSGDILMCYVKINDSMYTMLFYPSTREHQDTRGLYYMEQLRVAGCMFLPTVHNITVTEHKPRRRFVTIVVAGQLQRNFQDVLDQPFRPTMNKQIAMEEVVRTARSTVPRDVDELKRAFFHVLFDRTQHRDPELAKVNKRKQKQLVHAPRALKHHLAIQNVHGGDNFGVFAAKPIKQNVVLGEYTGRIIGQPNASQYLWDNGDGRIIDGDPYDKENNTAGWLSLINHASTGTDEHNVYSYSNTDKDGVRHEFLVTKREIQRGEELRVDYGTQYAKLIDSIRQDVTTRDLFIGKRIRIIKKYIRWCGFTFSEPPPYHAFADIRPDSSEYLSLPHLDTYTTYPFYSGLAVMIPWAALQRSQSAPAGGKTWLPSRLEQNHIEYTREADEALQKLRRDAARENPALIVPPMDQVLRLNQFHAMAIPRMLNAMKNVDYQELMTRLFRRPATQHTAQTLSTLVSMNGMHSCAALTYEADRAHADNYLCTITSQYNVATHFYLIDNTDDEGAIAATFAHDREQGSALLEVKVLNGAPANIVAVTIRRSVVE